MQTIRSYLELGELIRLQLLSGQNQVDDMLRQESEGSKVENLVAVIIYKLKNLLQEKLGAFVLYVSLSCGQESADCVHRDTTLQQSMINDHTIGYSKLKAAEST